MVPKHSAEVLSSVSKYKEVVMCFIEKSHVLSELVLLAVSSMLMHQ